MMNKYTYECCGNHLKLSRNAQLKSYQQNPAFMFFLTVLRKPKDHCSKCVSQEYVG